MTDIKNKDDTKNKTKNYANEYKPYWQNETEEKSKAPDRPEFRIFISHQKMGTETSGVKYTTQTTTENNTQEKEEQ